MAEIWTPQKRCEVMALVRSKGNKSTEATLARLFRSGGFKGWRRHLPLPGKPDFCFTRARVAVFVDGCFLAWLSRALPAPEDKQTILGWEAGTQLGQRLAGFSGIEGARLRRHPGFRARTEVARSRIGQGRQGAEGAASVATGHRSGQIVRGSELFACPLREEKRP